MSPTQLLARKSASYSLQSVSWLLFGSFVSCVIFLNGPPTDSAVFLPETKGRSLDEINQLFHERVTTLQSLRWKPQPIVELEAQDEDQKEDFSHEEITQKV